MRRFAAGLFLLLVAGALLGWVNRESIIDAALERFAAQIFAESEMLHDGDFHVVLCGTAGPVGNAHQRGACNAIVADDELILVDAGDGSALLASGLGLPLRHLSTILVTHLHHDHIVGIGAMLHSSWFIARTRHVTIYGPPGIDEVVRGFQIALAADRELRALPGVGSLDPKWVLPSVEIIEIEGDTAVQVFERGRFRVSAFRVDHGAIEPAYGYRIDFGDRSAVFTGDGRVDERTLVHARGADLLVHATVGPTLGLDPARIQRVLERIGRTDFPDAGRVNTLFSEPTAIAAVAERAGVDTLVYSHHPPIPPGLGTFFLWGVSDVYSGEALIGEEGMRFDFKL